MRMMSGFLKIPFFPSNSVVQVLSSLCNGPKHNQISGQTSVMVFFTPKVGESSEDLEVGAQTNMPCGKWIGNSTNE